MITVYLASPSPFKDIVPDFTIFGADFDKLWKKLLAGLLALLLIYTAGRLAIALATMRSAQHSGISGTAAIAKGEAAQAGVSFALVVCFSVLTVIVFTVLT